MSMAESSTTLCRLKSRRMAISLIPPTPERERLSISTAWASASPRFLCPRTFPRERLSPAPRLEPTRASLNTPVSPEPSLISSSRATPSAPSARKTPAHFSICSPTRCGPILMFHFSILEGNHGHANQCNLCSPDREGRLQPRPARRQTSSIPDLASARSSDPAFGGIVGSPCDRPQLVENRRRSQRLHSQGHAASPYPRPPTHRK